MVLGVLKDKLMDKFAGTGGGGGEAVPKVRVIDPKGIYEPSFKRVMEDIDSATYVSYAEKGRVNLDALLYSLKELKSELNLGEYFQYTNKKHFQRGSSLPVHLNSPEHIAAVKSAFKVVFNHKNWKHNPAGFDRLIREMPEELLHLEIDNGDYKVGETINQEKTLLKHLVASMKEERRQEQKQASKAESKAAAVDEFKGATEGEAVQVETSIAAAQKDAPKGSLRELAERVDFAAKTAKNKDKILQSKYVPHTEESTIAPTGAGQQPG